jgi:hypothetical protein
MKHYNILRALAEGKKCFMVTNQVETRWVLGTSFEQVKGRFRKWLVKEISVNEFVRQKLAYE